MWSARHQRERAPGIEKGGDDKGRHDARAHRGLADGGTDDANRGARGERGNRQPEKRNANSRVRAEKPDTNDREGHEQRVEHRHDGARHRCPGDGLTEGDAQIVTAAPSLACSRKKAPPFS